MATGDGDRTLAEDITTPIKIEPGSDYATPEDWNWKNISSTQPNAAVFHISHSESTRVLIDILRPSDSPPDANFVLNKEIPIVILDSLDKYWAAESRTHMPLSGVRVPVEGDTVKEAKQALINSRKNAGGIHFISVQATPDEEKFAGFWMLRDI